MLEVGLGQGPPRRAHELVVVFWGRRRRHLHHRIIAVRRDDGARFAYQAVGIAPRLDRAQAAPQVLPKEEDSAIGGT